MSILLIDLENTNENEGTVEEPHKSVGEGSFEEIFVEGCS